MTDQTLHTLHMLEVIGPDGYCKRYINGRRVGGYRWDLARVHASRQEVFQSTRKGDRCYHRHVIRCRINFAHDGDQS